jgi:site-specific DNA-methyltransferase (adenine-specific)
MAVVAVVRRRAWTMTEKRYNIIYADPPWDYSSRQFQDGGRAFKSLSEVYRTLTPKGLCAMGVRKLLHENCALFLWVTDSHLPVGLQVMEAWGFEYRTVAFVWVKKYKSGATCFNYAPWTMKSTELCLLGVRGKLPREKKNVRGLIEAVRTVHSKKPDEVRGRIVELLGDIPRLELFARERAEGWDAWGNEIESDVRLCA